MSCECRGFADSLSVRMKGLGAFVWRASPSLCGPSTLASQDLAAQRSLFCLCTCTHTCTHSQTETLHLNVRKLTCKQIKLLWNKTNCAHEKTNVFFLDEKLYCLQTPWMLDHSAVFIKNEVSVNNCMQKHFSRSLCAHMTCCKYEHALVSVCRFWRSTHMFAIHDRPVEERTN